MIRLLAGFRAVILAVIFGGASLTAAPRLEVAEVDPDGFADFSLHGQSPADTWIVFERELRRYWDARLAREVPDGLKLRLEFIDVDLAGRVDRARNPRFPYMRYFDYDYLPVLRFHYHFLDEADSDVAEGEARLRDPSFESNTAARSARSQYAFAYELELLRDWLRTAPWNPGARK